MFDSSSGGKPKAQFNVAPPDSLGHTGVGRHYDRRRDRPATVSRNADRNEDATSMTSPNAQYNLARPDSLAQRTTAYMRKRMYARFLELLRPSATDTILDVGATSDQAYDFSNYLEAWYPHKECMTATGIDDASHLERAYPGVRFKQGNGKELRFSDGAFDLVHSSAVIEHVGSRSDQQRLISEAWRVARRGIFLTAPNRWSSIEVHTSIPLVHWLSASTYRALFRQMGLGFSANEGNPNMLSRGNLVRLSIGAGAANIGVGSLRLIGWPSSLIPAETNIGPNVATAFGGPP